MFLFLTTVDKENQNREFTCCLHKLETALDFLNYVSSTGDLILKAELLDNGQRPLLIPQAFDETSFSIPLKQLEREWQLLLNEPIN